jgi:hypothetical protein
VKFLAALIVRRWTGALESEHTLELNAFVPKADIDERDPYVPNGRWVGRYRCDP